MKPISLKLIAIVMLLMVALSACAPAAPRRRPRAITRLPPRNRLRPRS